MNDICKAIFALIPNAKFRQLQDGTVIWGDTRKQPSEAEIEVKIAEMKKEEPMRRLREIRNHKLTETDWWCASDRTPTQAQLDYRKSLRDLTSSAKPKLDENNVLTNVTWPEKPE